jgi:hypothetical protein
MRGPLREHAQSRQVRTQVKVPVPGAPVGRIAILRLHAEIDRKQVAAGAEPLGRDVTENVARRAALPLEAALPVGNSATNIWMSRARTASCSSSRVNRPGQGEPGTDTRPPFGLLD